MFTQKELEKSNTIVSQNYPSGNDEKHSKVLFGLHQEMSFNLNAMVQDLFVIKSGELSEYIFTGNGHSYDMLETSLLKTFNYSTTHVLLASPLW